MEDSNGGRFVSVMENVRSGWENVKGRVRFEESIVVRLVSLLGSVIRVDWRIMNYSIICVLDIQRCISRYTSGFGGECNNSGTFQSVFQWCVYPWDTMAANFIL